MLKVNKHNPFPDEIRGDSIRGAFCEIPINNGTSSRYIVIKPKKYFDERTKSLMSEGIPIDVIHPSVKLMEYIPDEKVDWLYFMMTFIVEKKFHENQTVFADNRVDYKEYAFDDINKVLEFCRSNFNINESDFKKDWETNYPQW